MRKITIAVLAGTVREGRASMQAARYVAEFGAHLPGVQTILVDPRNFTFPGDGDDPAGKDPRYTDIVRSADGFFIVSPEYNHSFPGSLKRMLDSELEYYNHKPVALAGASNGQWGGVRVVEALLAPLRTLGLLTTAYSVYFPRVQDMFDEAGELKPQFTERYTANLHKSYDELLWLARALKDARDTRPPL